METPEKNQDDNKKEPFDLSFLEEDLQKLPDPPSEEAGGFEVSKVAGFAIDPSMPLEEQIEAAAEAARQSGIPDEAVESLKEVIRGKIGAAKGLINTAKGFASSPAFATMMNGSDEYLQALGMLGHEYHRQLAKLFGSENYSLIPLCQCEISSDPLINHEHSNATPPNAPSDYAEKRTKFVRLTKKFQRECAALTTLVFAVGVGGVQFNESED
tara:strand:+ start:1759 stop:2397 length:639 start_codon:yes stop_codon:yes gene_type:complete